MKLLFATTNSHKFEEIQALLGLLPVQLVGLSDVPGTLDEPEESGETLEENARIKAVAYARACGLLCLADDSGLEVEALGGDPGVRSARYSGLSGPREARDQKNREKLLDELQRQGDPSRRAQLVCTLCLAAPDGRILFETRGACEAEIVDEPRGPHGFGYDVLLYLPRFQKTAAEIPPHEWNLISHRGKAARAFSDWFEAEGNRLLKL